MSEVVDRGSIPHVEVAGVTGGTPIKLYALTPRRPDMGLQEFADHWRHPHGTWGCQIDAMKPYIQGHRIETDLLGPDQGRYDAIGELCFQSAADCQAMPVDPWNTKYLIDDCHNFVDVEKQLVEFAVEQVVDSGLTGHDGDHPDTIWRFNERPVVIKLFIFVEPDGNPDWAQDGDLELGRRIGALRHVRSYPALEMYGPPVARASGVVGSTLQPRIIGVRELSWPTLTAFQRGVLADRAAFDELVARPGVGFATLVQAERFA